MSTEQLGELIGEQKAAGNATNVITFILAIAAKFGLPSLLCAYLLFSINKKDDQIASMTEKVTIALTNSNNTVQELSRKIGELSDAIRDIKQ